MLAFADMHGIYIAAIVTTAGALAIFLLNWNVGGMGTVFWSVAIQIRLVAYFFGGLALLFCFAFCDVSPARFFYGRRKCPECGGEYDASFLALNFGATRYERCPALPALALDEVSRANHQYPR